VPETRPDIVVLLTDEERAAPPYESDELQDWRRRALPGQGWFDEHGVRFERHHTGSLACVPSRPTLLTGQYPDLHGVTQTDGLGKDHDDSRMRWLAPGEVPTLGSWFRAAGYDTHYDGKWHVSHADLTDPATGERLTTNDAAGNVRPEAVRAYLDADPLAPYGFSGWVGPEPHGGAFADCGLVRDPLIADRVVAWLEDRYARRRAGDPDALRPFLLVVSFVNPHDIVLFPLWERRGQPLEPSPLDPPPVPPSPTDGEDLRDKPAYQAAYRVAYPSGYGPAPAIARLYRRGAQRYRDLYHRLHAEVDGPLDRVRRAVTDGGSEHAVLVRTSDHGELLGSHGGLHQKWATLYDEATRVPFVVVRTGDRPTTARSVDAPTSHVDVLPTLLAAAGIDEAEVGARLAEQFSEVHPLPGRDLLPVVDGADPDPDRVVYLQTRDHVLEGDTGASALGRRLGRTDRPPLPLRIQVPAHVGTSIEGVVARVSEEVAAGGAGHRWKLVRTFDDPATWSEPGIRHLAADGPGGPAFRTEPLDDQWELYDLDADPVERHNRWLDPAAAGVLAHLRRVLKAEGARCIPERNRPLTPNRPRPSTLRAKTPPRPALALRRVLQRLGMHPDDPVTEPLPARPGRRALVIATNHGVLDVGKPTGVFASELTVPYYAFRDAGMAVDVASPSGGAIPVDPLSLKPVLRCAADDRFLADPVLREQVTGSLAVADVDVAAYDLVYLAGGWGAAFDFATSAPLADLLTRADGLGLPIGGVCHGPLGLHGARTADGRPLVEGRRISCVTDKQVQELGIGSTPFHPESALRARGARIEVRHRFRDPFANHWVVDGNLVTGQNQNAGPMVARALLELVAATR
jgi:arylsulfatase A-like enzyme/putative intracellular protease/amidase